MSKINLVHAHTLSPEQTRHAVQHIADTLSARFGLDCHWQGERLDFKRPGIDGAITLTSGQLQVSAQLGFLFSAMRTHIEREIRRVLQEKF